MCVCVYVVVSPMCMCMCGAHACVLACVCRAYVFNKIAIQATAEMAADMDDGSHWIIESPHEST